MKTKSEPCHCVMAFRNQQAQQACVVANQSETMFAAYWPQGRTRHRTLHRCIAVLEALGYSIEMDNWDA